MTARKRRLLNTLRPKLKASLKSFVAASLILSSSITLASDTKQFYEVGKQYLCIPRVAAISHMTLVQMTPERLVFSNRYTLKKSVTKDPEFEKRGDFARQYFEASIKSGKFRLVKSGGPDAPISYSRAAISCYKVTNLQK